MEVNCWFNFRYGYECDESKPYSSSRGQAPIDSIIYATKVHKDDLHVELEQKLIDMNEHLTVHYHKNCVSRYTSSSNIFRYAKDHGVSNTPPAKKMRLSHTSFDFSACIVENNVTYQRTPSTR